MEQLIIAVLGAFAGWDFLRGLLPFRLPNRIVPAVVAAIAYGILSIPSLRAQIAIAAVAGIPLLRRATSGLETTDPWRIRIPRVTLPKPRRRADRREATGTGFRPGGGPGRRIPLI